MEKKPLLIKSKADLTLHSFDQGLSSPELTRNQILMRKISAHLKTMSIYLEKAKSSENLTRPNIKSNMLH